MSGDDAQRGWQDGDTHDEALSALYRRLPREEPSTDLDAAILAAARRETHSPARRFAALLQEWRLPLASAATLLLAVTLLWPQLREPQRERGAADSPPLRAIPASPAPRESMEAESRLASDAARQKIPEPQAYAMRRQAAKSGSGYHPQAEVDAAATTEVTEPALDEAGVVAHALPQSKLPAPPSVPDAPTLSAVHPAGLTAGKAMRMADSAAATSESHTWPAETVEVGEPIMGGLLDGLLLVARSQDGAWRAWTVHSAAETPQLLVERLVKAFEDQGFTPLSACDGIAWLGAKGAEQIRLRILDNEVEVRVMPRDASCERSP